jgi:tripartite-type tricarboxylate transporter receptor subunit TctC
MAATPWGDLLGKPMVVDNRAGATGMIGMEMAARAAPDGYTLVLGFPGPLIIAPMLADKPPYDALKDFAPVSLAVSAPFVLLVSRSRRSHEGVRGAGEGATRQITYASGGTARAATWL